MSKKCVPSNQFPARMYKKEKPISVKSSASLLCNNLTTFRNTERGSLNYAVVHKYLINIVSSSPDGSQVTNKQVVCKEPSSPQHGTTMIMQAKWVSLPSRTVLVLTSLKGIQMFEYDGSAMLYWHAFNDVGCSETAETSNFGRGIASVGDGYICVGTQEGHILVFSIPAKGTNVTLKDTLTKEHQHAICDLESDGDTMASSDEDGKITMWKIGGSSLTPTCSIQGSGDPCSSLALWQGALVGAFGSGQLKVYSAGTGKIGAKVDAHARWINSIHVAKETGLLVSASEDSFVRVWQLTHGPTPGIECKFADCVTDQQLVGAQFVQDGGRAFVVTGYDSPELSFYVHS